MSRKALGDHYLSSDREAVDGSGASRKTIPPDQRPTTMIARMTSRKPTLIQARLVTRGLGSADGALTGLPAALSKCRKRGHNLAS